MFYVKSSDTEGNGNRWRVINTWNGGAGGIVVEFTSELGGAAGHNQCFKWIHDNKPFSFHEAVTHQGYKIEQVQP
jgi:hypothetical protein